MLKNSTAFSSFSVNNQQEAKKFYSQTLGLSVREDRMGLTLELKDGNEIFIYEKPDHQPATYTPLNFIVTDIDSIVDELTNKGVAFEKYSDMPAPQDDKGILRGLSVSMGPDIAWFKDPAGNILSVLQNKA